MWVVCLIILLTRYILYCKKKSRDDQNITQHMRSKGYQGICRNGEWISTRSGECK